MKGILIAAAAAFGVALAAPASAQMARHTTTTSVRHTTVERHDNGWHRPHWVKRKVCRTAWYHHRKVRRCTWRRVRVR